MTGIYRIRNIESGRIYIGSAKTLSARLRNHLNCLRARIHRNSHLQNAWVKHGEAAFVFETIIVCAPEHLLWYEQAFMDAEIRRRGRRSLYNDSLVAGSSLGRKHTAEAKAKIGKANKGNKGSLGKKLTKEQKEAISVRMRGVSRSKGRTIPPDVRAKIAAALTGHSVSAETRLKISKAGKGRHVSDKCMAVLKARKGIKQRPMSAATKAKLSTAKQGQIPWISGRKHSEETRAKMRAAKARRRAFLAGILGERASATHEEPADVQIQQAVA